MFCRTYFILTRRGGALRGIVRCCTWFCEIESALRIPCSRKALRPRLKCRAVFAARALRFVVFRHPMRLMNFVAPGSAVANCGNCSAPTAVLPQSARLKCTAVFVARALRFMLFGTCRGGALVESPDAAPGSAKLIRHFGHLISSKRSALG